MRTALPSTALPENRLRELRQGAGLEFYDLSARIRVHPATIRRWEHGQSQIPDATKLDLADFFGVTPAYLMGWPDDAAA